MSKAEGVSVETGIPKRGSVDLVASGLARYLMTAHGTDQM